MITSGLDYCNATFAGVADEQMAHRQKIQNNAARLIFCMIEVWSVYSALGLSKVYLHSWKYGQSKSLYEH